MDPPILLSPSPTNTTRSSPSPEHEPTTTEPVLDGGRRAWLFLIGALIVEGILYGFQISFGVFLKHYQTHASFGASPFLPSIGLLSLGILKLGSCVTTPVMIRYPQYRRHLVWAGWLVCCVALVASSSAERELWQLVLSMGVAYSVGFSVLYYPMLNMLNDWWVERRGFAYGIVFGLGGVAAAILPLPLEQFLRLLGSSWTLLIFAGVVFTLVGPALLLLDTPNKSPPQPPSSVPQLDPSVFLRVAFSAMTFSNLLQGLIFYLPTVFIPVFASASGLSSISGTAILSATNFTTTISQLGMGYLADISDVHILMGGSSLLSALVIFLFWGLAGQSLIRLLSFGVLFGLFSGGYTVLPTRFATALSDDKATQTWLYAIFDVQRGAMVVVGGLLSGNLVGGPGSPISPDAYGIGRYAVLITFCGAVLMVSSLGGLGWFWREKSFESCAERKRRRRDGLRGSPWSPPSSSTRDVAQLLSAFEHHVGLEFEREGRGGVYGPRDAAAHERYMRSFQHVVAAGRPFSVVSFASQDGPEVPLGATL